MPIDFADKDPIEGTELRILLKSLEKGKTHLAPIQERGVTMAERLALGNLAQDNAASGEWLARRGYDVKEAPGGQLAVRKQRSDPWRVVDPQGFDVMDVTDLGNEAAGIGGTIAGGVIGAGFGGLPGAIGGAAAGSAIAEGGAAALGGLAGIDQGDVGARVGKAALAGGAAEVGGRVIGAGLGKAARMLRGGGEKAATGAAKELPSPALGFGARQRSVKEAVKFGRSVRPIRVEEGFQTPSQALRADRAAMRSPVGEQGLRASAVRSATQQAEKRAGIAGSPAPGTRGLEEGGRAIGRSWREQAARLLERASGPADYGYRVMDRAAKTLGASKYGRAGIMGLEAFITGGVPTYSLYAQVGHGVSRVLHRWATSLAGSPERLASLIADPSAPSIVRQLASQLAEKSSSPALYKATLWVFLQNPAVQRYLAEADPEETTLTAL